MSDETHVREFLNRMADEVGAPPVEQRFVVRRARRHRAVAMAALALVVVASVTGSLVGLRSFMQTRPEPAVPSPILPSSPHEPLGLAIVRLDGTVQQDLGLPTDAWMPDLSPGGRRTIFLTASQWVGFCPPGCNPNAVQIAVVPVGSLAGRFVWPGAPAGVKEPVWSPDGKRVAYAALGKNGNRDIYVSEFHHIGPTLTLPPPFTRRLTFDPGVDEFPAWSPDGSTIFYDNAGAEPLDSNGLSSTQEIWSVPADGSGSPQRLTSNGVPDTQADVAADGTVAFWHEGDIWTTDLYGNKQKRLEEVPSETGLDPRWSPDGTRMALLRYDPAERAVFEPSSGHPGDLPLLEVVVVDLATGEVTTVGARVAGTVNPVSWTPDGSALLINRYDAGA